MGFIVFDKKGYRQPYHPGSDWRRSKPADEMGAFDEKMKVYPKQEFKTDVENLYFVYHTPDKKDVVITAGQIMSHPVITLTPEATLKEAWDLITQKRFRHIPIVTREKKIVGIVSDRTLLKEEDKTISLNEIMHSNVLTALPTTAISQIAKVFIEERIGSMPIVEDDTIVGIITRTDILRTILKVHIGERRV